MGCLCSTDDSQDRVPLLEDGDQVDTSEIPPNLVTLATAINEAQFTVDLCSPDMCRALQSCVKGAIDRGISVRHIDHVQRHFAVIDSLYLVEGRMGYRASVIPKITEDTMRVATMEGDFERLWKQFNH